MNERSAFYRSFAIKVKQFIQSFCDQQPIMRIREMNKRVNPCPLFTNFPYLPCTIDHDLRFFGFSLRGTENQDKTRRVFMLNMVGNLVGRNGDPFTFRYFQLDCEYSPIISKAQQIGNTLGSPRLYPNPFELWQMFLNLFPKVCLRSSQSNGSSTRFMRYIFQYAHKFDKIVYTKQGE